MYQVTVNDTEYKVEIDGNKVLVNDQAFEMDLVENESGQLQLIMPNRILYPIIEKSDGKKSLKVKLNGESYELDLKDHFDLLLEKMGLHDMLSTAQTDLKAPMPGLVLEVLAKDGEEVKKGDALIVLEAMKMENVIKAPGDGVVKEVSVNSGQAVEKNQVLITFE